jgi:DNA-binding response OmpR family regulator
MSGPLSVRPHVLVVEDDTDLLDLLTLLLREEGYLVTSASSLEQAMALLEQRTFHFILSDLFRQTSVDLLANIEPLRERAWPIPIAIMTAWNISEETARQRGFAGLIRKPFDIDHLSATIATCLNTPLTTKQVDQARTIERYYAALNSHDSATAASLCTEDFTYFPSTLSINPSQTEVRGRETYRAYLEDIFRFYRNLQAEIGSIAAHPRGLAVHHVMRWQGADDTPRYQVSGIVFAFAGDQIAQLGRKSVMHSLPGSTKPSEDAENS